jgi:hypothetical protein
LRARAADNPNPARILCHGICCLMSSYLIFTSWERTQNGTKDFDYCSKPSAGGVPLDKLRTQGRDGVAAGKLQGTEVRSSRLESAQCRPVPSTIAGHCHVYLNQQRRRVEGCIIVQLSNIGSNGDSANVNFPPLFKSYPLLFQFEKDSSTAYNLAKQSSFGCYPATPFQRYLIGLRATKQLDSGRFSHALSPFVTWIVCQGLTNHRTVVVTQSLI